MSHSARWVSGFLFAFIAFGFIAQGGAEPLRRIKVDSGIQAELQKELGFKSVTTDSKTAEYLLTDEQVVTLAQYLHEQRGRCGGFKDITDGDIQIPLKPFKIIPGKRLGALDDAELDRLIPTISEDRIRTTVEKLSSYFTRKYSSDTGRQAAEWIASEIRNAANGRTDVSVEIVDHRSQRSTWIMPSVIARLTGTEKPNESVILGGHLDSINMWGNGSAPGADDDASGVATALEAFKVLLTSNVHPKATVEFMAYSAEEVGLWGSQAIANRYRAENRVVRGVMQLDMVLYPSKDEAIYLITDNVDPNLTAVVRAFGEKKLGFVVQDTQCGYACSDHASWNDAGYSSVFPFEAGMGDDNPKIHTSDDTLQTAPWVDHAVKFGKLGLVFLWELAYRS